MQYRHFSDDVELLLKLGVQHVLTTADGSHYTQTLCTKQLTLK